VGLAETVGLNRWIELSNEQPFWIVDDPNELLTLCPLYFDNGLGKADR
jgi:hypothetical protein